MFFFKRLLEWSEWRLFVFRFEFLGVFWDEWGILHVLRLFFHGCGLETCKRFMPVTFGTFFRRLTIIFGVIEWMKEKWKGGMWGNAPYAVLGLWRTGSPDSSLSSGTSPGGCGTDETICWSVWPHSLAFDWGTDSGGSAAPPRRGCGMTTVRGANCVSHSFYLCTNLLQGALHMRNDVLKWYLMCQCS